MKILIRNVSMTLRIFSNDLPKIQFLLGLILLYETKSYLEHSHGDFFWVFNFINKIDLVHYILFYYYEINLVIYEYLWSKDFFILDWIIVKKTQIHTVSEHSTHFRIQSIQLLIQIIPQILVFYTKARISRIFTDSIFGYSMNKCSLQK